MGNTSINGLFSTAMLNNQRVYYMFFLSLGFKMRHTTHQWQFVNELKVTSCSCVGTITITISSHW